MSQVLFTIGYGGMSRLELMHILKEEGIRHLLDVRESPWGRRKEFNRDALESFCVKEGVAYQWRQDFGNPFRASRGFDDWNKAGELFREHLKKQAGAQKLAALLVSLSGPAALLCACSKAELCHRWILTEEVSKEQGPWSLVHLPRKRQGTLF